MRKLKNTILLTLFVSAFPALIYAGGDTPRTLMAEAGKAIEAKDIQALKKCYDVKNTEDEKGVEALAFIWFRNQEVHSFMDKGKEKFGDQFTKALGMTGFLLIMAGNPLPYAEMAQNGQVQETGDTARVSIETKEGNTRTTRGTLCVKKDGKWYLIPPDNKKSGEVDMVKKLWTFYEKTNAALTASKTAEEFKNKVDKINKDLGIKMK